MTVLVLGIAMVLPLGLYVTVKNLRALDLQQENWGTITVFLKSDVGASEVQSLVQRIENEKNASAESVSPEQGMEEFREASGFAVAPDLFEENPLPWVLLLTPRLAGGDNLETSVAGLADWLQGQDEVDLVQVDFKWMQRMAGMLELGDAFVSVLTVMFSLAVIFLVRFARLGAGPVAAQFFPVLPGKASSAIAGCVWKQFRDTEPGRAGHGAGIAVGWSSGPSRSLVVGPALPAPAQRRGHARAALSSAINGSMEPIRTEFRKLRKGIRRKPGITERMRSGPVQIHS
jgi:hypothetical protein